MDDETAEIELLEQNLNKTRQISQKMTAILSSFDSRLIKLENSILPLYNSTKVLQRRATNIESAIQKIQDVASNQEGTAEEEALILRGPQSGNLQVYKDALERLNANIAFKSSDSDSLETARIIETGAKKVAQLYTKLVAEGSSGTPPGGPEFALVPFSSSLLSQLQPLVQLLRTLPLPTTHPSHPAASEIQSTLNDAQRGYGEMRGSWSRACLEAHSKRLLERVETVDAVHGGQEFGVWVENLMNLAEQEYDLLTDLAAMPTSSLLSTTFSSLISPLISLFSATLSSLQNLIKRSLNKYTFLALSTFASLTVSQARWHDLMCRRTGRRENELKDGLHALRAVCLRSFPEFLAGIKAAAQNKGGELSTNVADFTMSAVEFIERVHDVKPAVGSALLTLGDGNWKMGDGVTVSKASRLGEGDEDVIIEHFVYDVVNTTVTSLSTLARIQRRPAFGSIFLINNISHLRTHLLTNSKNTVDSLLSGPTREVINSNFRTAKAGYFDSNFSPLMQALAEDKDKSKSATKEKFTRFFDLLAEIIERHNFAQVLPDEEDVRETISEEVNKLVVPAFLRFTQRNSSKDFSKNPQKYIKMSAQELETQLRDLYS